MALRAIPKVVQAINHTVIRGASSDFSGATNSGTAVNSTVIDRLAIGPNKEQFFHAQPFVVFNGLTTLANKNVSVAIKLQHGKNAGGTDMKDLNTDQDPPTVTQGVTSGGTSGTAETGASGVGIYSLREADRYLRVVVTVTLGYAGAASDVAGATLNIAGGVVFLNSDLDPVR